MAELDRFSNKNLEAGSRCMVYMKLDDLIAFGSLGCLGIASTFCDERRLFWAMKLASPFLLLGVCSVCSCCVFSMNLTLFKPSTRVPLALFYCFEFEGLNFLCCGGEKNRLLSLFMKI